MQNTTTARPLRLAAAAIALLAAPCAAQNVVMSDLGMTSMLSPTSASISDDGLSVVACGWAPGLASRVSFRWSAAGGVAPILVPGALAQCANAVSGDGAKIAGFYISSVSPYWTGFTQAFSGGSVTSQSDVEWLSMSYSGSVLVGRGNNGFGGLTLVANGGPWTANAIDSVRLGVFNTFGGTDDFQPTDVTADGSQIVGLARLPSGLSAAFRSVPGGVQALAPGNPSSLATAVSADGAVVVGSHWVSMPTGGVYHAFRWTSSTGVQDLGALGGAESFGLGVSADGQVIVGQALDALGRRRAFRWSAATGVVDLGTLGGDESIAYATSGDGGLIVGTAQLPNGVWRAFLCGYDQPDCDGNGVFDSFDIARGTLTDANANGVPDDCECTGGAVPTTYCTAKVNSLLCTPSIAMHGIVSASGFGACEVTVDNMLNNRSGTFFYGYQTAATPFQGGYLCVQQPLRRTPIQNTGGSSTGTDCSGTLSFDLNQHIAAGNDPVLQVVGQMVAGQFWSRDPFNFFYPVSLSNAVQARVCQ